MDLTKTPVVAMEKVCFAYQTREVLHDVSFQLNEGEMMAIVGPNGGGKTTLVQLMLGLLNPKHGNVQLLGSNPKATRHRVGYVPQNMELDPLFPISVLEVVQLGLLGSKISPHKRHAIISKTLETTGAAHLTQRRFSSLSGGEKQRVIIAHALVSEPSLLVMDEPTANVDPESEHDLYELFKRLNTRLPIMFVSHNLNVVSRYVSHVLCVNCTARAHPIGAIMTSTFTELFGGELAILDHGSSCHVTDPTSVLRDANKSENHPL
jgi:zinc transport system ATP-binding protein